MSPINFDPMPGKGDWRKKKKIGKNQCAQPTPRTPENHVQEVRITWLHLEATVPLSWATPEHGSSPNRKEKGCSFSIFCTLR